MNEPSKPIDLGQSGLVDALGSRQAEGIVVQGILAGESAAEPREFNPDIVKRSVVVAGHKTSVSLEDAFWHALKDIARERSVSLRGLVAEIDASRRGGNLSSAVRLFVLDHYRRRCSESR
ncbi:ribbon-helix-helix domain-containing protein [Chenggangzhangella methanolivorans]|uniref:Ribbon-helix-helix domain-containing protein n=1 Tax=Chenggangzhangella methanolivorans TaxID=1437009 RepID=A0A9E6UQB1_9HYPH|nr:ribbon-helix-helix domain-containing protein [Chenggangzhangella methanolivorans]